MSPDNDVYQDRPRLLDLFCGAGGAGMGYYRAGFAVTGVDINPQPHYPFQFLQKDALEVLDEVIDGDWRGFDAIHASPPCQTYSSLKTMPNAGSHPDLVAPTRDRLTATGLPWVIENVMGAPLDTGPPNLLDDRNGIVLCGSMFRLHANNRELRRHRLFESNVPLSQPVCRHRYPTIGFHGDHARDNGQTNKHGWPTDITGNDRKMPLVHDLMGIDWMDWHGATQAIPPAYTEYVGRHLLQALEIAA